MARIESTAVNEFIDLVGRKPMPRDPEDDWLFSPGCELPEIHPLRTFVLEDRPTMPLAARARISAALYEAPSLDDAWQPTVRVARERDWTATAARARQLATRFALPIGLFGVLLILVAGYLALDHRSASAASRVAATPATAEPPVVAVPEAPVIAAVREPTIPTIPTVEPIVEPTVEPIVERTIAADPEPTLARQPPARSKPSSRVTKTKKKRGHAKRARKR